MPIAFPSASFTAGLPTGGAPVIPRSIGGVQLNDRVNTFTDNVEYPFSRLNKFELAVGQNGRAIRTRHDWQDAIINVTGFWFDGAGRIWLDFYGSLATVDGWQLDLGNGRGYPQADVLDVVAHRALFRTTEAAGNQDIWAWSIKFQAWSALAVAM